VHSWLYLFRTHLNPPLQGRKLQPLVKYFVDYRGLPSEINFQFRQSLFHRVNRNSTAFFTKKYHLVIKQYNFQIAIFINQSPPRLPSLAKGRVGDGFYNMFHVKHYKNYLAKGILAKVSTNNFQNFCTDDICTFSSGECGPLMFGPNEIISQSGYFSLISPHSKPA